MGVEQSPLPVFGPHYPQSVHHPRTTQEQPHLPHPSVPVSRDGSPYQTSSDTSSRSSLQDDSEMGDHQSSYSSQAHMDDQPEGARYLNQVLEWTREQLAEEVKRLSAVIDQILRRLERLESRMSALEDAFAEGSTSGSCSD
jgi:hypothetical protein